jgi:hypothetical protein
MFVRGRVAVLEDVDGRALARGLSDEGEREARQDATPALEKINPTRDFHPTF